MDTNMNEYLVPTDPPAPFPTLTLAAGDNALSFDTTVQPEKAEATFTGWHDAPARSS